MIGQQLGGYVIERCIGDGGMGSVYLGVKAKNGERAAIKILRPELARNAEMVQRILREGRAAGCISHPGIVKILESGLTPKGSPYVIMEYLEGQPLSAYLQERRKLPVAEALRIGQELAAALLAAHAKHVIHRDLKPDNIFRLAPATSFEAPHVKILDFGIALMEEPGERKRLTRAGSMLGTPCYMAPEVVVDPRAASAASDAYSLGVILYQMLVGEPPFTAEIPTAVLFKQVNEPAPELAERAPGTPPALCTLVHRLLSKKPAERPTMIETFWVLMGIERSLPPPSTLAQRMWRGGLLQRSVLWIGPSLFICAVAAGITQKPHTEHVLSAAPSTVPAGPPTGAPTSVPAVADSIAPAASLENADPALDEALRAPPPLVMPPLRLASDAPIYSRSNSWPATNVPRVVSTTLSGTRSAAPSSQLDMAKLALAAKLFDTAIFHARLAVKDHPYEAWQIIGRASCGKKDRVLANEAKRRLSAALQSRLTYDCLTVGLDLRK